MCFNDLSKNHEVPAGCSIDCQMPKIKSPRCTPSPCLIRATTLLIFSGLLNSFRSSTKLRASTAVSKFL